MLHHVADIKETRLGAHMLVRRGLAGVLVDERHVETAVLDDPRAIVHVKVVQTSATRKE